MIRRRSVAYSLYRTNEFQLGVLAAANHLRWVQLLEFVLRSYGERSICFCTLSPDTYEPYYERGESFLVAARAIFEQHGVQEKEQPYA